MRGFTSTLLISFAFACSANAAPVMNICKFTSGVTDCQEIRSCEGKIKAGTVSYGNKSRRGFMSPRDFSMLLKNIEEGKSCAQHLGFTMFEASLKSQNAGYLEELSIALSYSIEVNPTSFLKGVPDNFLLHDDVLGGLCCRVHDGYEENSEYRKKHLKKRLEMLGKITDAKLIQKRKKIDKAIRERLALFP